MISLRRCLPVPALWGGFMLSLAARDNAANGLVTGDLRCTPDTQADVTFTEQKAG